MALAEDETLPVGVGIPSLAMNNAGQAVVLWSLPQANTPEDGDYHTVLHASTLAAGASDWRDTIEIDSDDGGKSLIQPRVALNNKGLAVATWQKQDHIWASNRLLSEAAWQEPTLLDTEPEGDSNLGSANSRVAINDRGHAVVVWQQKRAVEEGVDLHGVSPNPVDRELTFASGAWTIRASRYALDGGCWCEAEPMPVFLPPVDVDDSLGKSMGVAFAPSVAIDADSRAVVVWETYYVLGDALPDTERSLFELSMLWAASFK